MALVINKRNAPLTFARSTSKEKMEASSSMVLLTLNPGINEIVGEKEPEWEFHRKSVDGQAMLSEGFLIEVRKKVEGKEGEEGVDGMPENLSDLDPNMARELANSVIQMSVLEAWLRSEKRTTVTESLKEQIKRVKEFDLRASEARAAAL